MGMKIIMGLIGILPMSLTMHAVMWFDGRIKGNILFGVTLWQDALDLDEVKRLQKNYKRNLLLIFLGTWVLFFVCCIPSRESIVMSGFMLMILILIVIYFIPFAVANKKLMKLKYEKNPPVKDSVRRTITVDIKAASEKEPVVFLKSALAGVIIGIIPFVLEIFIKRTDDMEMLNLFVIGSMGLAGTAFLAAIFYFNKMKTEVISAKSSVNIQLARVKHYQWSKAFTVSIWANTAFTFWLWLRMGAEYISGMEIVIVAFAYAGIIIWVMFSAQLKIIKVQNKYAEEFLDTGDEDKYWIFGMIYYNKNDKHFMVNKRVGMGTTVNMAKTSGKVFAWIISIITVVSIIGSCVWMLLIDFTPVKLEFKEGKIISSQIREEYEIEAESVTKIELLDKLPELKKRVGTGMETIYKGSFTEYRGAKCQVCVRRNGGCYIRLTTDDNVYYLNDEKPEKTLEIYESLKKYTE